MGDTDEDKVGVLQSRNGDPAAFESLIRMHQRMIHHARGRKFPAWSGATVFRPGKMNKCETVRPSLDESCFQSENLPLAWKRLHLKPKVSNWQTLLFFQLARPSKLFPRQPLIGFEISPAGLGDDIRRQHRAGRGFVPIQRFQVVADKLFVKTRLALARRVLVGGPEA